MFLIFQSPLYDVGGGGGEVSGLGDAGRWLPCPSCCLWPPSGHPQQVLTDVRQLGWDRSTGPTEGALPMGPHGKSTFGEAEVYLA